MKTDLTSMKCEDNPTELSTKWYFQAGQCEIFTRQLLVPSPDNSFSKIDISDPVMGYETNWRRFDHAGENSNCAWYIQTLEITDEMLEYHKLFIEFTRVYFFYSVWLNGHCLGECYHGYFPCKFNIKPFVKVGKNNTLAVYVADATTMKDYPTGAISRMQRGIFGPVKLQKIKDASINDVFVRTSVDKMRLEFDLEIEHFSEENVHINYSIRKGKKNIDLDFSTKSSSLTENVSLHTYTAEWSTAELWEPENPVLYELEIKLLDRQGIILDSKTMHFGFKEFGANGSKFMLNGQNIGIRGVFSQISHWEEVIRNKGQTVRQIMLELKNRNINCIRFVGQPYLAEWLDIADEVGMMVIAETALYHSPVSENSFEHFRRMIIRDRNHPSIIFWSSSNEFEHWKIPRDPKTTEFLLNMQELAHKLDPTRLVQNSGYGPLDGKEDIINIHYPLPHHAFINLPEGFDWINTGKTPNRLNSGLNWQYDKPLAYGEQMLFQPADRLAVIAGDDLYTETANYKSGIVGKTLAQAQRWNIEQSRLNGVAMISSFFSKLLESPYGDYIENAWKPVGCFFKNRCTQLFSGRKYVRELVFYNDNNKEIKCRLSYSFADNPEKSAELKLSPGTCTCHSLPLHTPEVEKRTNLTLKIQLTADGSKTLLTEEVIFSCFPENDMQPVSAAILSSSDILHQTLESGRIKNNVYADNVLVIGEDISDNVLVETSSLLCDYVAKGNTAIILPAKNGTWREYSSFLPFEVKLMKKPLTISFKAPNAKCFDGLENDDLRFWGEKQRISEYCFIKPVAGNYRALADAGSIAGLNLSPLLELNYGKGQFILASYLFAERALEVPAAAKLLKNLCNCYAAEIHNYKPCFPTAIICESAGSVFKEAIEKLQVEGCLVFRENIDFESIKKYKIWILENSSLLELIDSAQVEQLLEDGLTIICNSVAQGSSHLLAELKRADGEFKFPLKKGNSTLNAQMRLYDLRWINKDSINEVWTYGETAEQAFNYPALLEEKVFGKGKIVLNNIRWEHEKSNPLAAVSFFSSLLNQLKVKMSSCIEQDSGDTEYKILDIKANCNRSMPDFAQKWIEYQDLAVLNENRSLNNEEMKMMPELAYGCKLMVDDVPLEIIDPRKNRHKSAIVPFNCDAPDEDLAPPVEMDNIRGVKIDIPRSMSHIAKVYFFHTAAVNWRFKQDSNSIIGYYQVNYYCGRKERIPIIMEYNVGKFKVFADTDLADAKIAACYPGPNSNSMSFYIASWSNRIPQEKVMDIEFLPGANLRTLPVLLGITIKESNIQYI
jgi:hypothetical protein